MLLKKSTCEWMIAGLGNPEPRYDRTRHNAGFRAIDLLADKLGVKITRVKCKGLTATAELAGHRVLLLKPQTYMNCSGQSVLWASQFFKIPPERILVLSDDISLPVGKIRVRAEGSAGGHNGLKSIIADLGSQNFPRIKIGIGEKPNPEYELADWVLSGFTEPEEKLLAPALENAVAAAEETILHGAASAANKFNGK